MSDRARVASRVTVGSNLHEFVDRNTHERVQILTDIIYRDDFVGAGSAVIPAAGSAESGVDWTSKIVGAAPPTVASVANAAGGQFACTLTAASQKQDAALYHGDVLAFDITKGLIWEARVQLSVLPSAASVQAIWGLSAAWIDGPDNAAAYIQFAATANGAVLMRAYDGVTAYSVASGVTLLNSDYKIFRIDATDVTDIKFYIDGVQVSANSAVAFAATGATAILQPYFSVYKPSGTGVATLKGDYVKIFANRS